MTNHNAYKHYVGFELQIQITIFNMNYAHCPSLRVERNNFEQFAAWISLKTLLVCWWCRRPLVGNLHSFVFLEILPLLQR